MRTTSTLVGLVLFTLTATARAEEAAPAAAATAPPAGDAAAAPAPALTPTSTPTPTPTPAATASAPPASDSAAAPTPVIGPPAASRWAWASQRKIQIGFSFLPMEMGKYTFSESLDSTVSSEAYFAYGFALSAGYEILPGLIVGFAPQVIFDVQPKPSDIANPGAASEYDFMARVAYAYRLVDTISVYAEVLPGYSQINPPGVTQSTGFVLAFGAGCAVDMTDRFFINVGGGYQMGFQSQPVGGHQMQLRTKYVRLALGGGVKF